MIEWRNPQPQKAIRELRLKMTEGADAQIHIPAITALVAPNQKLPAELLAVTAAAAPLALTSLQEGANVLPVGQITADTKGRPAGWNPFEETIQATVGQEENRKFARITATKPGLNLMKTYVDLKPEWKALRVRAKARVNRLQRGDQGWKTAEVGGLFWDDKWNIVGRVPAMTPSENTWKDVAADWPIPAGAVRFELSFGLHEATGEIDVADLQVLPLANATP
jgi:hypothetical protein